MTLLLANWKYVVIAALLAIIGVQSIRISALKTEKAEYVLESEKAARVAVEQAIAEQTRRQQAYDQEAANARNELKDREATINQLASDGDRVRDELAAFQKRASCHSKTAVRGKSELNQDPIALLSILLSRADSEAEELAGFADRLRIAGLACERASDNAR